MFNDDFWLHWNPYLFQTRPGKDSLDQWIYFHPCQYLHGVWLWYIVVAHTRSRLHPQFRQEQWVYSIITTISDFIDICIYSRLRGRIRRIRWKLWTWISDYIFILDNFIRHLIVIYRSVSHPGGPSGHPTPVETVRICSLTIFDFIDIRDYSR